MNVAVTCVIPSHGRPALLARALRSVSCQSERPSEVLVVDDLDDPETRAVVRNASDESALNIHLVPNLQNPGACNSRNLGASRAANQVIAFLDDDDEWHTDFLHRCLQMLSDTEADVVCSYLERCYPDGRRQLLTTSEGLTAADILHHRVYVTGSSLVVRRNAFEKVGGFDPSVPVFNDWDLFIRLVRSGARYRVVKEPLAFWNEHDGDRITSGTLKRADGIERFLNVYGPAMSPEVLGYYLRLATGIRRGHDSGWLANLLLTARMLRRGGLAVSLWLARDKISKTVAARSP